MKGKVFTAQEVQAMLNGSKVMFREVVKLDKELFGDPTISYGKRGHSGEGYYVSEYDYPEEGSDFIKCPHQVGQKIFVKEIFAYIQDPEDCARAGEPCEIDYKADYDADGLDKQDIEAIGTQFSPASKMPQWASRLILQIKEIGVEKLGDISESDCMKEGCFLNQDDMGAPVFGFCEEEVDQELGYRKAQDAFKVYWNATHKKPEEQFEGNPWVWKILFEVVK